MAVNAASMTLVRFLELPEEEPALEFFAGQVSQKDWPLGWHSRLRQTFLERITGFAEPRKLGLAFPELRVTFAGASVVPDISVYRWGRIPLDERGRIADDFWDPSDVTIQITLPRQSPNAHVRRCLWYLENGVTIALLVDPEDQTVLSFRPRQMPHSLVGSDRIEMSEILPGFELTAASLFRSLYLR